MNKVPLLRLTEERKRHMPKPSRHELFCAAVYTLTGGKLKGLMVTTVADQLGITFEDAEALAAGSAKRKWLEHAVHTTSLREDGFAVARILLQTTTADETQTTSSRRPKVRARAKEHKGASQRVSDAAGQPFRSKPGRRR